VDSQVKLASPRRPHDWLELQQLEITIYSTAAAKARRESIAAEIITLKI
jgi:hypothetical protein